MKRCQSHQINVGEALDEVGLLLLERLFLGVDVGIGADDAIGIDFDNVATVLQVLVAFFILLSWNFRDSILGTRFLP